MSTLRSQERSAHRVKREQEATLRRMRRESAAPARAEVCETVKRTNKLIKKARRLLDGPPHVYVVVYVPATGSTSASVHGDARGRPYRKLSTAEGAAAAISSAACVLPIERWA